MRYYHNNGILLLDDDADIVAIFSILLQKQRFQVSGFTKPLLALGHFKKNYLQYELVISDLTMPGMDGYEFIKKVKEIKPKLRVFLMTANDIDNTESISHPELDEFISKPISGNKLGSIIKRYMDPEIDNINRWQCRL